MRKRYTSTDGLQTYHSRATDLVTGGVTNYTGSIGIPSWSARVFEDELTPRFRSLQKQGVVVVNNMASAHSVVETSGNLGYVIRSEYHDGSSWQIVAGGRLTVLDGYSPRARSPYTSIADRWAGTGLDREAVRSRYDFSSAYAVEDQTLLRVTERATSSEALALVTVAELGKTIDLIHDLGQSAMRFDKIFRKLTSKERKLFSKAKLRDMGRLGLEVGSAWLAYRYGIMATYYDVMSWVGGHKALQRRNRRARFVASTQTSYDSGVSHTIGDSDNFGDTHRYQRFTRLTKTSAGVLTRFDLDIDSIGTFGIDRLMSTTWELIPYSFVLDWFVDAGSRISAAEGKYLRPILGSWITHRHQLTDIYSREVIGKTTYTSPSSRDIGEFSDYDQRSDVCMVVERKANPELSALPHLNVRLNWKRLADGIALLSQAASRSHTLMR